MPAAVCRCGAIGEAGFVFSLLSFTLVDRAAFPFPRPRRLVIVHFCVLAPQHGDGSAKLRGRRSCGRRLVQRVWLELRHGRVPISFLIVRRAVHEPFVLDNIVTHFLHHHPRRRPSSQPSPPQRRQRLLPFALFFLLFLHHAHPAPLLYVRVRIRPELRHRGISVLVLAPVLVNRHRSGQTAPTPREDGPRDGQALGEA
ncbi:hypothetical protein BDY21DRAFT_354443 [Lineolata rhizophorae]|uniref:Uncharacterized protein n=1 Tax=Lineolata rhizophorae TaxID=578093 RepID=A0A6A6NR52_9PEZI|nr:hypothetical protein BDY21DRAFT_354443 [Lineolata rhizophorae]